MRKVALILFVICFASIFAYAQAKPFSAVDAFLSKNHVTFSNDEEVVKLFNIERIRLGDDFESETWKYLGDDIEKHYWISAFVVWKDYLQGNEPLPKLAFKIKQRGVELLANAEDESSLGKKITFLRDLAIASYLSGNRDAAIVYKSQATPIYEKYKDIGASVGATTRYEYCVYDNLGKDPTICKEDEPQKQNEPTANNKVIAGKPTFMPEAKYPKKAQKQKISGEVQVRVLIDANGNIISAEAVRGPKELHKAAVEAAKLAKFSPTLLEGKPTKVSAILVYKFVL